MHSHRYHGLYSYHYTVPFNYIYWNSWVRWRVTWNNGYIMYSNYPYYAYNGYRHRYSNYDLCNYELVDGHNNRTVRTYPSFTCSRGYDQCSVERDRLNYSTSNYRYFCSERFQRDSSYNYNHNYASGFYDDLEYNDNVWYDYNFDNDSNYNDYMDPNSDTAYSDDYGYDDGYGDWDDDDWGV